MSLAPALNADNCFLGFFAPHFGHFGAGSEKLRARCSKVFPHLSQLYSYMGIYLLLIWCSFVSLSHRLCKPDKMFRDLWPPSRSVAQAGRTRVNTLVNIERRRESPRPYVHLQPGARHLFQQIANTFRFNPKDRIPFVAIKSSIVLVGQSFKRFPSYDLLMASLSHSSLNYFLTSQVLPMSFLQQSFLC